MAPLLWVISSPNFFSRLLLCNNDLDEEKVAETPRRKKQPFPIRAPKSPTRRKWFKTSLWQKHQLTIITYTPWSRWHAHDLGSRHLSPGQKFPRRKMPDTSCLVQKFPGTLVPWDICCRIFYSPDKSSQKDKTKVPTALLQKSSVEHTTLHTTAETTVF